jgi:hypothetical protein
METHQVGLPSPYRRPFGWPGRPLPADVTDNRVLWGLDVENMNALFGKAFNESLRVSVMLFTWESASLGWVPGAPPAEADACGASPAGRRGAGSAFATVGGSRAVIGAVPWFIFDL